MCEQKMFQIRAVATLLSLAGLCGCAGSPSYTTSTNDRLDYIERFCDATPLTGYTKSVSGTIGITYQKLQSLEGKIGVEELRKLQHDLQQYTAELELKNRMAQTNCRTLAECRYYHTQEGSCMREQAALNTAYEDIFGVKKSVDTLQDAVERR